MEPKTTSKQKVSKGEYARYVVKRIWFILTSLGVGATLAVGVHCAGSLLFPPHRIDLCASLRWAIVFVPVMMSCAALCRRMDGRPEPGPQPPGSRAANPLAPETLVRASSAPVQPQQAVLLRAAEEIKTPPEQLMRAAGGQE